MKTFKEFIVENVCSVNGTIVHYGDQVMVKDGDKTKPVWVDGVDGETIKFRDGSTMSKADFKKNFISVLTSNGDANEAAEMDGEDPEEDEDEEEEDEEDEEEMDEKKKCKK